jgi:hypothetical protein
MFDDKDRPRGWEFPACNDCNSGTSHVDLVGAFVGRLCPGPSTAEQIQEFQKILNSIKNNIHGAAEEMKRANASRRVNFGDFSIGPVLQKFLDVFCLKFALAAHFEATGNIVPLDGAVIGMYLTNRESENTGDLLTHAAKFLPSFSTLQQGAKNVSDQFVYACGFSEKKDRSISVARFRQSFELYASTANNIEDFGKIPDGTKSLIRSPSELKKMIFNIKKEKSRSIAAPA